MSFVSQIALCSIAGCSGSMVEVYKNYKIKQSACQTLHQNRNFACHKIQFNFKHKKVGFIQIKMGNSKTKPGIFISTNKLFYLPGEVIQGNVFINAPKPYPSSRVILNITGYEKTFWKSSKPKKAKKEDVGESEAQSMISIKKDTIPNEKKYKSKNLGQDRMGEVKIFQISHTLSVWSEDHNMHGQYAYPFNFFLPSYIPASFRQENPQYKASISYQITCVSISPKKQFSNLLHNQQIVIRLPQKQESRSMYGELFLRPTSCCCCSQGVSKISCFFEKNQYFSGEVCNAVCQIDNYKSKAKIKEVKAKFKKITKLISNQGEDVVFSQDLNQVSFPGVDANQQYIGLNAKKIPIPIKYRKSNIPVPPTTNGKLIQSSYQLELSPILAGCCSKNTSLFTVGLEIIQEAVQQECLEAPPDWHPQVFNTSNIYVDQPKISNEKLNRMQNPYY